MDRACMAVARPGHRPGLDHGRDHPLHALQGRSLTLLSDGTGVLAFFAVADTNKESSRRAIADLHAPGVDAVMLTGDNSATAQAIASHRRQVFRMFVATCSPRPSSTPSGTCRNGMASPAWWATASTMHPH